MNKVGENFEFDMVEGNNVIVFVRSGSIDVQGQPVGAQGVALMKRKGSRLQIRAKEEDTKVLVLAGEPIREPIRHMGPFCMNTDEELEQAQRDYYNVKMG